jgi:cobalt-zinc-cadmium efflux system outer membrane protein
VEAIAVRDAPRSFRSRYQLFLEKVTMRNIRTIFFVLVVLVVTRSAPLHAQAGAYIDATSGVGLAQLVQLALTRNADLLAARQQILEAQGLLRQAGFRPNPVLETEFSSGSPTGSPGERSFSLGYAHTFELGGKRARRIDLGETGVDLARLEITDRERTLRAELQERYIAAMAAIRNLEAVTQQLEVTQQSYAVTMRRVSEGESPRVEQMVLQAEVGRLTAERLLLTSEVQQAMLDVRVVAGIDISEPLRLQPDGDRPPVTVALASALERGIATRPDLLAAREEEARSDREIRLAQADRVPDMAALVRYSDTQSRFDLFGLTASGAVAPLRDRDRILTGGLSITLPMLSRNQGQIAAARARQRAASLRREYLERVVRAEITGTYGRYLAARQAVEIFETAVIQPSQESVRVLRASYTAGEVRLFDVLTEQRRLIDTQKAYTDAIRQEALARVALERAIGAPLP